MSHDRTLHTGPQPVHILIVDDESFVRLALARELQRAGLAAEGASSGDEALAKLQAVPYDVMVVDLSMPGMSGLELMQRAHQLRPEVLMIILTGHATLESAIAAVRSEAADYLVKPVSGRQLLGALSRILQQRALRQHRQQLVQSIAQAMLALRRSGPPSALPPDAESAGQRIRHLPPLTFDTQRRHVMLDDGGHTRLVELSEGEAAVLATLMSKPGQVLSCGQLSQAAWNYTPDDASAQNMIRPIISRLRRKLAMDRPQGPLIRTVRGRGYTLSPH